MSDITLPTAEQQQRAKWDLLLLDIEKRTEELRQLKTYEPRRLMLQAITSSAALLGGGAAIGAFITATFFKPIIG
jgi:hypothetical protein